MLLLRLLIDVADADDESRGPLWSDEPRHILRFGESRDVGLSELDGQSDNSGIAVKLGLFLGAEPTSDAAPIFFRRAALCVCVKQFVIHCRGRERPMHGLAVEILLTEAEPGSKVTMPLAKVTSCLVVVRVEAFATPRDCPR